MDFDWVPPSLDRNDARSNRSDLGGGLHAVDVAARRVWQVTNPENARLLDLNTRELGLDASARCVDAFHGCLSTRVS